jgi:uncharacterized protein YjbI with pentapeptide repeats
MPADSELWLPPLPPKDQKKANRRQKYQGLVKWSGLPKKTLWDWLQLLSVLAVPVMIAAGTLWFSAQQSQIAQDQQQENAFQAYLDRMSDLLLNSKLRESKLEDEVRKVARGRTLTVLPQLYGIRKGELVQFLYEAGLIDRTNVIVDLRSADLSGAYLKEAELGAASLNCNLSGANLYNADLRNVDLSYTDANLSKANLSRADLDGADLTDANLNSANLISASLDGADLGSADLTDANFSSTSLVEAKISPNLAGANFSGANLYDAEVYQILLTKAKSLQGATMPDGSKHP